MIRLSCLGSRDGEPELEIVMTMVKYYSIIIQVDFDTPRSMPSLDPSEKPWRAVGYLQQFFCTERSKEQAKRIVHEYFLQNEDNPDSCRFRFDLVAWMRGLTNREQLTHGLDDGLTKEMFNKRNEPGIWYCGEKQHYVSEDDYAETLFAEENVEPDDEFAEIGYEGQCQACDAYVRVNDISLCDDCAGKLERDLIRRGEWDYCASAFGLPVEAREKLRNAVIKEYGPKLELIAASKKQGKQSTKRSRKRRRK